MRHDAALACTDANADRFGTEDGAEGLTALRQEIQTAKDQAAQQAAEARDQAASLQRSETLRRLEAARAKGDAEAIRRYERLLGRGD